MAIKVRPYQHGGAWEVDIRLRLPDGTLVRERKKSPFKSKTRTRKWGEERLVFLYENGGKKKPAEPIPTVAEFFERFVEQHYVANRAKPSTIHSARSHYRNYIEPVFGERRLNDIKPSDIAAFKHKLCPSRLAAQPTALIGRSLALSASIGWPPCVGSPQQPLGHLVAVSTPYRGTRLALERLHHERERTHLSRACRCPGDLWLRSR